ncbi:hypothetical protein BDW74DRAFT_148761 [Aspergillus multicolor]|uniref:uncharacterized protein n=1 Tax=Aspergillus multicolor TaxID=41759 RepID=UPI003CCDC93C
MVKSIERSCALVLSLSNIQSLEPHHYRCPGCLSLQVVRYHEFQPQCLHLEHVTYTSDQLPRALFGIVGWAQGVLLYELTPSVYVCNRTIFCRDR